MSLCVLSVCLHNTGYCIVFNAAERLIETRLELEGAAIQGLASLDDNLYVLRRNKSLEQIEVYDINTYRLLHCLTVLGLHTAVDIVACGHNRRAYISDSSQRSVHKISLFGEEIIEWPVKDTPGCLSLSIKHGVLVTCRKARKIKEFTEKGILLHEIVLSHDVSSPWHTIQLSSSELIVCHGIYDDPLHRVCLIGSDGQVLKSFEGPPGSGRQNILDAPAYMAVDSNRCIFVIDRNNDRVLLLSPALTYVREVVSHEQLQWKPYRLSIDVKRRRLYVAVSDCRHHACIAGRVIVLNV